MHTELMRKQRMLINPGDYNIKGNETQTIKETNVRKRKLSIPTNIAIYRGGRWCTQFNLETNLLSAS